MTGRDSLLSTRFPRPQSSACDNKLAIALAARAAMRQHRKGKPIAFQWPTRWSDPTYLGDGPWGA